MTTRSPLMFPEDPGHPTGLDVYPYHSSSEEEEGGDSEGESSNLQQRKPPSPSPSLPPLPSLPLSSTYAIYHGAAANTETPLAKGLRRIRLVVIFAWAAVLWTGVIYKLATGSVLDYVQHLTNWAWTVSAVFYGLEAASLLTVFTRLSAFNVASLFWLNWGVHWIVFTLMFFVLYNNSNLLSEIAKASALSLGVVYDGDRAFHVVPSVVNLIYLVCSLRQVRTSVATFMGPGAPLGVRVAYAVFAVAGSPLFLVGWYVLSFDAQHVYGITLNTGVLFAVGAGTLLVFSGIAFTLMVLAVYSTPDAMRQQHSAAWREHYRHRMAPVAVYDPYPPSALPPSFSSFRSPPTL
jgi:hypothetical protein